MKVYNNYKRCRKSKTLPNISNNFLGTHKILKEEDNSSKFQPTSPKDTSTNGTTEVKKVTNPWHTAKGHARTVEQWATKRKNAPSDLEK